MTRCEESRGMQVLVLSRTLAVKTLQLEMEYIFAALEDEAVDVAQGTKDAGFLLSRCIFGHPFSGAMI